MNICEHTEKEYKIHLDQEVCRCGMRRDVSERGHGTDWLPRDYWTSLRQDDHFMRGPDLESIARSIEGLTLHGPLPGGLTDGERHWQDIGLQQGLKYAAAAVRQMGKP